ncbi:MAG: DUF3137 domain-containing protein [Nostoc sp. DedSLP03]|uniref:DUF3137 domain-containing protein n=1 Tax=Nostoc sp. DedSLP03 TaxID=3075400 RepID=UPI002AD4199E|nr:DUF3137 domain-containing protein [Nostoc sp. DedSLP03]MDZ7964486.1 DUF3137 domain-containing protein [Nostoc sp. DedSLP03]
MSKSNSAQNHQLLHGISKLLEYKKYNLALQELENFFQKNTESNTKEYLYAQVLLLDAYLYNGHFDKAINLCQELSNSKHQTTQILAQYYLAEIFPEAKSTEQKSLLNSPKSSLTPAQATELLNTGYEAITKKCYPEAIQALIYFFQAASPDTKEYLKAHKLLIKAYQGNGQINHAIALCQQLLINEHEPTRKWARQLLFTDLFTDNIIDIDVSATLLNPTESQVKLQPPSENLPEEPEPAIEKFTPKTLKEFKVFCQENLLSELKVFESRRKQVLLSIVIAHLLFLSLGIALLIFFPVISSNIEVSNGNTLFFQIGFLKILIPFTFIILFFNYLVVVMLITWFWILFYTSAFETFSTGFQSKIKTIIFTFINQNKNLKYVTFSSQKQAKNSLHSFQHSQLFKGLIIPNKIVQDDYIYGKVNGVDICLSNICAELELKHSWTNTLDITFLMSLKKEKIINHESPIQFIISIIRIFYFFTFFLPFTFYICFLIFRLIKLVPYIFNNILRGKAVEYKKIEAEIFRNEVTRTSLIFKGLFFKAKFNKNLRTVTIVQPKAINANIHALNHAKKQVIKLEDPEFAKLFTVYGDDQIEARYVLSTNLMDKIVTFRKKTNRNIYISFVDDMIYIAIEEAVENNIIDPNLYKSVLSFAPLREYFETLNLMLGIVEDLNLDRHI